MVRNVRLLVVMSILLGLTGYAQNREFKIHNRGMLHQTVYNTGEIGRAYDQGTSGGSPGIPSLEWPGKSGATIDGKQYNGQYNSFGAGVYIAANRRDSVNRMFSFGGAFSDYPVAGVFSYPQSLQKTENFPILSSGEINPTFNPDEAEEVIVGKWNTNTGVTVTRTSRAWSHPDYDDMIIYEYEMENTGRIGSSPNVQAFNDTLKDVLFGFTYALNPSMFGYERIFNRWDGADFGSKDMYPRFDRTRWMNYSLDRDGKPDPAYFVEWSQTGKFGGGLLSPQAVGFLPLYYDTSSLSTRGQTALQHTPSQDAIVWDANNKLKQPFLNRMETGLFSYGKIYVYLDLAFARKNNPYTSSSTFGPYWTGRGSYNWRQSNKFGIGHILVFGPYIMPPGHKIRFAVAEVAGYGAARLAQTQAGLKDEGGSCGELCGEATTPASNAFNPVPNWYQTKVYGGNSATHGSNYLSNYPLPQYVNSNVVTIREVADRAISLYTGRPLAIHDSLAQYLPEGSPSRGVYNIPISVPAPVFKVSNTALAENKLIWGPQAENFSSPRLQAPISHYEVYKASHPLGPWTRIDSVGIGDLRYFSDGSYEVLDRGTRVGEAFYYSILSVDANKQKSGRTNTTLHQTQLGGTEKLEQVYVVPNPFIVQSGFGGTTSLGGDAGSKIGFYNLPNYCTIRIFSYSGQLVQTIEHNTELYSTEYLQVTRNNQFMASGLYFYVVDTPDGNRNHGKFVIIH